MVEGDGGGAEAGWIARCLCGGIEVEITGRLGPLVLCHCSRCRRAGGSAFGANCNVRRRYWRWLAGEDLVREFDSSPGVFRAFCSRCGSPIYSRWDDEPDVLRLRLGLIEGDPGRRPLAHFHVASKAPWYEISDDLPRFDGGPADHPEALERLRERARRQSGGDGGTGRSRGSQRGTRLR